MRVWTLDHSTYRSIIAKHRREDIHSRSSDDIDSSRDDDVGESDPDETDSEGAEDEEDEKTRRESGEGGTKDESHDESTTVDPFADVNEFRTLIGHCGNVHSVAFSKIGMLVSQLVMVYYRFS